MDAISKGFYGTRLVVFPEDSRTFVACLTRA